MCTVGSGYRSTPESLLKNASVILPNDISTIKQQYCHKNIEMLFSCLWK